MKTVINIFYKSGIVFLLLIILPVMIVICMAIALNSGFPILYKQMRVGKGGRQFTLFKFRTMVVGAANLQAKYKNLNEADGPVFKIRLDPRFTRFGRFLSHTGFDELPQLFNVIKGEMALIGPRPLPVEETRRLKPWQKKRLMAKPGIVSPWIVQGYHTQSFDSWMKSDLEYLKHKNIRTDLVLLYKTVGLLSKFFATEMRTFFG